MTAPRVRVALPWLQAALADATANECVPPLAALRWLGGRGRLQPYVDAAWREWLLAPTDRASLLTAWPAGPAVASATGADLTAPGSWCLAQPVHLAPGLDHLRLAPLAAAAPTDDEARELALTVAAHFGPDEIAHLVTLDGTWLLRCGRAVQCTTQPPDHAVGHNVRDYLPAGPDGARVRSVMNEIQMLLHENPVNERRARAGQLPINAWWLWGFGSGMEPRPAPGPTSWQLRADDRWLRALWGSAGQQSAGGTDACIDALSGDTLIAWSQCPAERGADALAAAEAGLLTWLVAQWRAGAIGRLDLLAGGTCLHLDAGSRFQFWRRPADVARWLA